MSSTHAGFSEHARPLPHPSGRAVPDGRQPDQLADRGDECHAAGGLADDLWFWFISKRFMSPVAILLPVFLVASRLKGKTELAT